MSIEVPVVALVVAAAIIIILMILAGPRLYHHSLRSQCLMTLPPRATRAIASAGRLPTQLHEIHLAKL